MSLISNLTVIGSSGLGGDPSWIASYQPQQANSSDDFYQWTSVAVNSSNQIALGNISDANGRLQVGVIESDGTFTQSKHYDLYCFGIHQTDFDPSDRLVTAAKGYEEINCIRLSADFNSINKYFAYRISYQQSGYSFGQGYGGYGVNNLIAYDNASAIVNMDLSFYWNFGTINKGVAAKIEYDTGDFIRKVGVRDSGGQGLAIHKSDFSWACLEYGDFITHYYWQGNYSDDYDFQTNTTGNQFSALMSFNNQLYLSTRAAFWRSNTDTGSVVGGKSFQLNGVAPNVCRIMTNDGDHVYFSGQITISSIPYLFIIKMNTAETVFEAKLIRGSSGSNLFGFPDFKVKGKRLYLVANYGSSNPRRHVLVLNTDSLDIDGTYPANGQNIIISSATVSATSVPNFSFSYLGMQSLTDTNSSSTTDGSQQITNTTTVLSNLTEL